MLPGDRATAKALLEIVQNWRRSNLISSSSYAILQGRVEGVFRAGGTGSVAPAATPVSGLSYPTVPPAVVPAAAVPPRPPGPGFGALLAERQADILLYLGAFLLAVAALIFVAYQEGAVSVVVRVPVLAAYTIAGLAGGVLIRRWERVREAGQVFIGLGALLVPLNFILLYTDVLRDRDVPLDLVWVIASVFCLAFYGTLAATGFGWLYRVPAAIALLSGWTALASLVSLPAEWAGAWFMTLAAVIAAYGSIRLPKAVAGAAVLGGFSLLLAYGFIGGDYHWQLAVTNGIAAAAIGWTSYRLRFGAGLFAFLLVLAAMVAAVLWPLEAPSPAFAYPFLVSGALALRVRAGVPGWPRFAEGLAWLFAAAMSLAPIFVIDVERHSGWSGLGFTASACLLAFFAWKNTEHGLVRTGPLEPGATRRTSALERMVYAWAAAGYLLAAAALWQEQVGVTEPGRGWLFAGMAVLPALTVAAFGRFRSDEALAAAIPISAAAALVALPREDHFLFAVAFLAIPGVAWILAALVSGRATAEVVGTVFLAAASFFARAEYAWEHWQLAAGFAATGIVLFATFTPRRRYPTTTESDVCAFLLSWGLHAAAVVIAVARILDFQSTRFETGRQLRGLIVERADYRLLVVLAWLVVAMVAVEGLRLRNRPWLAASSVFAMLALLLTIGLANPENVQAYTVPMGVYLLVVGLVIRRSAAFIPPHVQWHETALIAGVGLIVLPQAEQSFESGGAKWGLVLIGEGLFFLALAFVLRARWLVPAGTLVLSGVAVRWLLESGETVPYWVTLGLIGTLLLGGGLFVLVNIEWWNRTRARASRWWQETGGEPSEPVAPSAPLGGALH